MSTRAFLGKRRDNAAVPSFALERKQNRAVYPDDRPWDSIPHPARGRVPLTPFGETALPFRKGQSICLGAVPHPAAFEKAGKTFLWALPRPAKDSAFENRWGTRSPDPANACGICKSFLRFTGGFFQKSSCTAADGPCPSLSIVNCQLSIVHNVACIHIFIISLRGKVDDRSLRILDQQLHSRQQPFSLPFHKACRQLV